MNDVKAFILKRKNTTYNVNSFLCGSTSVWSGGFNKYFTFTLLEDDTYSIKATDVTNIPAEVVLPTTYEGKPVTKIEDYAFLDADMSTVTINNTCTTLKRIVIPESYTYIGDGAFFKCENLEIVEMTSSITEIGDGAFQQTAIKSIFIPSSVTKTGFSLFFDEYVTVYSDADSEPNGWGSTTFGYNPTFVWGYNPLGDDYLTFTEQADGTYSVKAKDVSNLPSVVGIPWEYNGKAVNVIEDNAFKNATTVTKVVIPNGVTSIGSSAFEGCTNLTEINIPGTVTTIKSYAFSDCESLPTIIIPNQVTTMEHYVFWNCSALSIYCQASSKPEGWSSGTSYGVSVEWNPDNRPVTWGYTG
jgi:hypothetical protein